MTFLAFNSAIQRSPSLISRLIVGFGAKPSRIDGVDTDVRFASARLGRRSRKSGRTRLLHRSTIERSLFWPGAFDSPRPKLKPRKSAPILNRDWSRIPSLPAHSAATSSLAGPRTTAPAGIHQLRHFSPPLGTLIYAYLGLSIDNPWKPPALMIITP